MPPNPDGSTIDWRSIRALRDTLRLHLAEVPLGTHLENEGGLLIEEVESTQTGGSRSVRSQWKSTVVASANKLADLLALERTREPLGTSDWSIISNDPETRLKSELVRQASTIETTASALLASYDAATLPIQEFELFEAERSHGVFSERLPLPGTLITLVLENGGYRVKVIRVELGTNDRLWVIATQDVNPGDAQNRHMTLSIE